MEYKEIEGYEVLNAVIEENSLFFDDVGLAVELKLYFGYTQYFYGHLIYMEDDKFNYVGLYISRILEISGVRNFAYLKNRAIRILWKFNEPIIAIGHIVRDDWFYPCFELPKREIK